MTEEIKNNLNNDNEDTNKNKLSKKSNRIVNFITLFLILGLIASFVFIGFKTIKPKPVQPQIAQFEQARLANKPIVALFYSKWCGYCQRFMPIFDNLSGLYKDNFNFVKIDVEAPENRNVMMDYKITGLPTVYIIDPQIDNRVLINNALYRDAVDLKPEFDRYLRIRNMIPNLKNN